MNEKMKRRKSVVTRLIAWLMVIALSSQGSVYASGGSSAPTTEVIVEEVTEEISSEEMEEETVSEEGSASESEEEQEMETQIQSSEEATEESNSEESVRSVVEETTECEATETVEKTTTEEMVSPTGMKPLEAEVEMNEGGVTLRELLVGQPIKLGNQVGDILYSKGKYIRIDDEFYFSNEEGIFLGTGEEDVKICDDAAENLNYVNGLLYYTVKEGKNYKLISFDLDKGERTVIGDLSGYEPRQMYFINDNTLLFLSGDVIYTWDITTEDIIPVFEKEGILGYIPTDAGCVYALDEYDHYTVYLENVKIAEDCSYYSLYEKDGEYLYYSIDGRGYYIKLTDIRICDEKELSGSNRIKDIYDSSNIASYNGRIYSPADMGLAVNLNELLESCKSDHEHEESSYGTVINPEDYASVYQNEILVQGNLSEGQKNMVKTARQMAEIEWTALADVDGFKKKAKNKYTAGTRYVGLPYGQCTHRGDYIYWECSLETFIEKTKDVTSEFYTGEGGAINDKGEYLPGPYYGMDCGRFVSKAWNLSTGIGTGNLPKKGRVISDIEDVEVGDALIKVNDHTILIGGVTKENGTITNITVYHSTEPLVKVEHWTMETFRSIVESRPYTLYRNDNRDSVEYKHSCVVPIDGDTCSKCNPVAISKTETNIYVGDTQQLTVTGADSDEVSWKSGNKKIVTVSKTGLIKGIKKGLAVITATVNGQKLTCTVNVADKTLTINPTKITLYKDQDYHIIAETVPQAPVVWKSSNEKIATVVNGTVKAVAKGTATITAKANGKTKKCTVIVNNPTLKLSKTSVSVVKGTSAQITATPAPDAEVVYSSNKDHIATVNEKGFIIAKEIGTAVITVKANGITKKCTVKVTKPTLTLSNTKLNVYRGYTGELTATPVPKTTVEWKSSNEKIATVTPAGVIKGIKCGTVTITATAHGVKKKCTVTVKKPTITLSKTQINICKGEKYQLKATPKPVAAVTWTSSNNNIVKVSSNGQIEGVALGTAYITAESNGEKTKCKVKVNKPTIKLSKTAASLYKGEQVSLSATTRPVSAVTWTSSNEKIATVSSKGVVKGISPGTADIMATANGVSTKCRITVKKPVISVSPTSVSVYAGYKTTIKATPKPSATVKWTSSDTSKATVSNGTVTGRKAGVVFITATANGVSAQCKVTVKNPTLTLSKTSYELYKGQTGKLTATAKPSKSVVWKSSNENIVKVSGGVLTAKGTGTATITATAHGITRSCVVKVKAPTLTISRTAASVYKGELIRLYATATPTATVKWKSGDTSIATVSSNGTVTGKKEGIVYITATAHGITRSCKVTVKATSFIIDKTSIRMKAGTTIVIGAKAVPARTITWKTSNSAIATVSNGKVVAKKKGNVVITAKANGYIRQCRIVVY